MQDNEHKQFTQLSWVENKNYRKAQSCTPNTWHGQCKEMHRRAVRRCVIYAEGDPPVKFESIHDRWKNDIAWRMQKTKQGWTEALILEADEEAVREGESRPMSLEQRERLLPPYVLRQSKVGGASIKTTDHPTYQQAWDQHPSNTGAGSSIDLAPWRYPVKDNTRQQANWNWDDDEDEDEYDYYYAPRRRW